MGFITRWLLRRPRKRQGYRQYAAARARRERYKARYDASHPRPAPETFAASVRLADGSLWECEHAHRTRSAAQACGEQYGRAG
jgi:hypothetical protein